MLLQRPSWLPAHLPELDGLRGFAILGVVLYHCNSRFEGLPFHYATLWGWSGVQLFFALSGFLVTSGLLATREKPNYLHNFHAKRAIRIWPIYLLTIAFVYLNAPWFIGPSIWQAVLHAQWWGYLFIQNLFPMALPAALVPTWALAVEEQFYFCWAPLLRWLRRSVLLTALPLMAALVAPPLFRRHHPHWIVGNHTLIKLDALALGALLALALYSLRWSRRTWIILGCTAVVVGFASAATFAGGTYLLDSALSLMFTGLVLATMATTGARSPLHESLRRGPLPFYGRISYSLFLTHIPIFVFFGWWDLWITGHGIWTNVAILAERFLTSTLAAWALYRWVETPLLKRKKRYAA